MLKPSKSEGALQVRLYRRIYVLISVILTNRADVLLSWPVISHNANHRNKLLYSLTLLQHPGNGKVLFICLFCTLSCLPVVWLTAMEQICSLTRSCGTDRHTVTARKSTVGLMHKSVQILRVKTLNYARS